MKNIYTLTNIPQENGSKLEIDVEVELIEDQPRVSIVNTRRIVTLDVK